jgi:hypothetical protein
MKRQPWPTVVVFVVIWVALASISPTRTLHLAPVIIGAWPLFGSVIEKSSLPMPHRIGRAGIGVGLGVATTAVLALTGGLEGPSLLPAGGAALEAIVFSFLGGLLALAIAPIWREQK